MLVLSRKKNEAVDFLTQDGEYLGEVVVVEVRGDKVRLGFNAPETTVIHRREVLTRIAREGEKAKQ